MRPFLSSCYTSYGLPVQWVLKLQRREQTVPHAASMRTFPLRDASAGPFRSEKPRENASWLPDSAGRAGAVRAKARLEARHVHESPARGAQREALMD